MVYIKSAKTLINTIQIKDIYISDYEDSKKHIWQIYADFGNDSEVVIYKSNSKDNAEAVLAELCKELDTRTQGIIDMAEIEAEAMYAVLCKAIDTRTQGSIDKAELEKRGDNQC